MSGILIDKLTMCSIEICLVQARRVDSVEGGSFMFWEVFFSAGGANTCAEGASL